MPLVPYFQWINWSSAHASNTINSLKTFNIGLQLLHKIFTRTNCPSLIRHKLQLWQFYRKSIHFLIFEILTLSSHRQQRHSLHPIWRYIWDAFFWLNEWRDHVMWLFKTGLSPIQVESFYKQNTTGRLNCAINQTEKCCNQIKKFKCSFTCLTACCSLNRMREGEGGIFKCLGTLGPKSQKVVKTERHQIAKVIAIFFAKKQVTVHGKRMQWLLFCDITALLNMAATAATGWCSFVFTLQRAALYGYLATLDYLQWGACLPWSARGSRGDFLLKQTNKRRKILSHVSVIPWNLTTV